MTPPICKHNEFTVHLKSQHDWERWEYHYIRCEKCGKCWTDKYEIMQLLHKKCRGGNKLVVVTKGWKA